MQFNSKEDIEAPIERVFAAVTDFESFERAALRRGAEEHQTDNLKALGVGCTWDARFEMRGRRRDVAIAVSEFDPPNGYKIAFKAQGLEGEMNVELVALSKNRTRLAISMELQPKTLSARLLVQSLKLAKMNLTKRFQLRVADFARDMEDRLRGTA